MESDSIFWAPAWHQNFFYRLKLETPQTVLPLKPVKYPVVFQVKDNRTHHGLIIK